MVWPLVFWGWLEISPVVIHTRLMALGCMGSFIFGFLGTSLPRLLETRPMAWFETGSLLTIQVLACGFYLFDRVATGDLLIAVNVVLLVVLVGIRFPHRKDLPAPGFLIFLPAFVSLMGGLALARWVRMSEDAVQWDLLARLLIYHGFLLCCLLGAGGFLLPRFLGLGLRRRYGSSRTPDSNWGRSGLVALFAGVLLPASFAFDVYELYGLGGVFRALVIVGYFAWEMPLERLRWSWRGVDWALVLGLVCLPLGVFFAGWFAGYRVALTHIELGGVGLLTFGVATRVVMGHTGGRDLLERFHPWLTTVFSLMVIGVSSRIAGEMIPRLMVTHYIYGALCWAIGGLIWGWIVIKRIPKPDPEG